MKRTEKDHGTSLADEAGQDEAQGAPQALPARGRRRRALLRAGGAAAAVIALLLGGLWIARKPVADQIIARTLRARGVQGSYEITRIGPRTQRLENLVLGDPARPDLTARRVEVDFGYSLFSVRVARVRAQGVRLSAAWRDGALDMGSLNKLMGEGGGEVTLPDMVADLQDVRVRLATDGGDVGIALEGRGNLRAGFSGRLAAVAPRLTGGGCALERFAARAALASEGGRVHVKGPVTARTMACADMGLTLAAPRINADVRADPALEAIDGALALAADEARQGERAASRLSGLVTFKGSLAELRGGAALSAERTMLGFASTGPLKLGGQFAARPRARDQDYSYAATLTAEALRPQSLAALAQAEAQAAGTPLAPLATRLARALREATQANRLTVSGRLSGQGPAMRLLVNGADFSAASGAHVALADGSRATLDLPSGAWALDGRLTSGGGGLPEATLTAAPRPDGGLAGTLTLADYRAGTARLGLTPLRFTRTAAGALHLVTAVSLDGPIGDGAVKGLSLPVDAHVGPDGAVRLAGGCAPLRWSALRVASLTLDPVRVDLCGLGGPAVRTANIALAGAVGDNPLRVTLRDARYALDSGRFALADLAVRIGAGEEPVQLDVGTLEGAYGRDGAFAGTLADGAAVIGPVPLSQSAIAGAWRFADGALTLDGAMRVSDRQTDARFEPLDVRPARLRYIDGRIEADGTLVSPKRGVAVAAVTVGHDLGSGVGQADFNLTDLRFGQAIQPDDLTQLSQGIVQLVEGPVEGSGTIRWSSEGVTGSTGTFAMRDMDFAAAFGPVQGFSTTLHFTDLLGMRTAPHQRLTVRQVSAGVDVFDGVIDYALLSNERAQIEGGYWPFSGGTLELLPAELELDARRPRYLTFRVTGIDAGAFIETMELENIYASGTFDGLFPMIFDAQGGRMAGGLLVARQAGLPPLIFTGTDEDVVPPCDATRQAGLLSYVGPVSDAQLGTMGRMAFDVLKRLGYKCLTIQLDGALDGEFVTQVSVNGVNRGSAEAGKSFLTRPFVGLPFIFNVRIEAPFRGLMGTAASFADPRALVRGELDRQMNGQDETALAVQPADSEKDLEGKQE